MDLNQLGRSGPLVSKLSLGTMTFGAETEEKTAFKQMDLFLETGGLSRYPSMRRAIEKSDLISAANESERNKDDPAFDARDEWTRKQFEEATRIEAELE